MNVFVILWSITSCAQSFDEAIQAYEQKYQINFQLRTRSASILYPSIFYLFASTVATRMEGFSKKSVGSFHKWWKLANIVGHFTNDRKLGP